MTISYIIPVLNGEKHLRKCLDSIRAQMRPGDQLIVMDNGSTDSTVEIARSYSEVTVHVLPQVTVAALRNAGAQRSSTDVLAFIDSDCILLSRWRDAVEETLRDTSVAATGSMPEVSPDATWVERAWGSLKFRDRRQVSYIAAMNFVMRKSAFTSVSGFDASLITDEDSDICRRLAGHNLVMIEEPRIAAVHLGNPRTLRAFVAKERWHATSIMATMRLHGLDKPMVMTFAFMLCCLATLVLLGYAATGRGGIIPAAVAFLVVPVVTVVFRLFQYRNFSSAAALVILYSLFYAIRSLRVISSVFSGGEKE